MPRRARMALVAAASGLALLVLLWYSRGHLPPVRHADRAILAGFTGLSRPSLDRLTQLVAGLCDPKPYVVLALVPVLVALVRRRPRVAVAIGLSLLAANVTTELLKPALVLAPDLRPAGPPWVDPASFPSGHATASMSLLLAGVIAAPARWRGRVAAGLAGFTVAVCWSFLELGWHYPSDVLGGFLVAAIWMLLGAAALDVLDARRPRRVGRTSAVPARSLPPLLGALWPMLVLLSGAALMALLIALARPQQVLDYASRHAAFVVGAAAIGAAGLGLACAAVLALGLSAPAPGARAPRRPRPAQER